MPGRECKKAAGRAGDLLGPKATSFFGWAQTTRALIFHGQQAVPTPNSLARKMLVNMLCGNVQEEAEN